MVNDGKTKAVGGLGLDIPIADSGDKEGTNFNDLDLNDLGVEVKKPSLYEYVKLSLYTIKNKKIDGNKKLNEIRDLTLEVSSGELRNYKEYNQVLSILNDAMQYQKKFKNIPIEQNKEYNLVQSLNLLLKEQAKILHKQKRHATLKSKVKKSLAPKIKLYSDWLFETAFTEDYANLLRFGVKKPEFNLNYQVNKPSQYFKKGLYYAGLSGAGIASALIGVGLMYLDQKYAGAITVGLGSITAGAGMYKSKLFSKKHDEEYQKLKGADLEKILNTDEVYNAK